jgi:hypothetical protein
VRELEVWDDPGAAKINPAIRNDLVLASEAVIGWAYKHGADEPKNALIRLQAVRDQQMGAVRNDDYTIQFDKANWPQDEGR